jgi:ABC-type Fe3+/spermidine/putrescine transport system ATPase subunit
MTFLLVTHDQDEALQMSDRIAVMRSGGIEQVGTPPDLYEEPATAYVADFLGTSNLLTVGVDGSDLAGSRLRLGDFYLRANLGTSLSAGPRRSSCDPSGLAGTARS